MQRGVTHTRHFVGQAEQLAELRAWVEAIVTALGATSDDCFAFCLATDEAAANIFEHTYAGEPGEVGVAIWREDDTIVVRLDASGQPFDPGNRADPDLSQPLDQRTSRGLGLFLIRKTMDQVLFEPQEGGGTRLTLRRAVGPPPAAP